MTIHSEHKNGYKKTKLGWIPEEWEVVNLSKIVKRLDAGVSVNSEDTPAVNGEFGILKTSCVYANDFNPKENKTIKPDEISRAKLNPKTGRIIISRMNTPELVGACGYVKADYPNLFLPDRLWQTTFKKEFEKSGLWLFFLLNTSMYRYKIQNLASGTSNSMKNISKSSILKLLVPLPSLQEQQKIATILSSWDKAIELTQQLIEAKEEQKKGLMQRLLTGKVRMKGYSGEWEAYQFKDIFEIIKSYAFSRANLQLSDDMEDNVYNIHYGDIHSKFKGEFIDFQYNDIPKVKDVFEVKSKKHYLRNGDIILADASEDYDGVGECKEIKNLHDEKAVGGLHTFVIRDESNKTTEFFRVYCLKNPNFRNKLRRLATGSSVYGLSKSNIMKVFISIPQVDEQTAIAAILIKADKEIDLLNQKLEAIKEQKKGLMQVLLVGEIRVNTNE